MRTGRRDSFFVFYVIVFVAVAVAVAAVYWFYRNRKEWQTDSLFTRFRV